MKATNENFMNALAIYNGGTIDELNRIIEDDEFDSIVETSETLADFKNKRGNFSSLSENTDYGFVAVFENIQRAKGMRRGDLYVVEFSDKTLTYFDGE